MTAFPLMALRFQTLASLSFVLMTCAVLAACGGGSAQQAHLETTGPEPAHNTAPVHPVPDSAVLMGMTGGELESLFGEPGLKRQDPPAELWQYRDERCSLNLYLYPPKSGSGSHAVDHFHVVSLSAGKIATTDCLYSLTTGIDPAKKPAS